MTLTVNSIPTQYVIGHVAGFGTVPIVGTYTGADPVTIKAELFKSGVSLGVQTIGAPGGPGSPTIGSGSYVGSIQAPKGAYYSYQVTTYDGGGNVLDVSSVSSQFKGVGWVIGDLGSSSSEQGATLKATGIAVPDPMLSFSYYNGLTAANYNGTTPYVAYTQNVPIGAWEISFGNTLASLDPGVPILMCCGGVTNTFYSNWTPQAGTKMHTARDVVQNARADIAQPPTTPWTSNLPVVCHAFMVSGMSGNDASGGLVTTLAAAVANMRTIVTNIRSYFGAIPVGFNNVQRQPAAIGNGTSTDVGYSIVRAAELIVSQDANNFEGSVRVDLDLQTDLTHVDVRGNIIAGERSAYAVANALGITSSAITYLPTITGATYSTSTGLVTCTVSVPAGHKLKGRSGSVVVSGVQASTDSGATFVPVVATITDATHFTFSLASGLGSAPCVGYMLGISPDISNPLMVGPS